MRESARAALEVLLLSSSKFSGGRNRCKFELVNGESVSEEKGIALSMADMIGLFSAKGVDRG